LLVITPTRASVTVFINFLLIYFHHIFQTTT
jgi:hypothetical protein